MGEFFNMKKPTNLQELYDVIVFERDTYIGASDQEFIYRLESLNNILEILKKELESKNSYPSLEELEKLKNVKAELKSLETEVSKILLRILNEQVPLFSSDRLKTLHNDCRELLNRVGRKGMLDYRYKLIETVNILKLVNWILLQMDNKHLDDHEFLINATREFVKNMEDFLKGDL